MKPAAPKTEPPPSTQLRKVVFGGSHVPLSRPLSELREFPLLPRTPEASALITHLLASGILPAVAEDDAAHIGLAAAHGMDFLLTWNCRHINNTISACALSGLVRPSGWCVLTFLHARRIDETVSHERERNPRRDPPHSRRARRRVWLRCERNVCSNGRGTQTLASRRLAGRLSGAPRKGNRLLSPRRTAQTEVRTTP